MALDKISCLNFVQAENHEVDTQRGIKCENGIELLESSPRSRSGTYSFHHLLHFLLKVGTHQTIN